jgi:hypothetical protein
VLASVAAIAPLLLSLLTTPLAEDEPGGETIIDFELAGSVDRAKEILATWRSAGVIDDAKAIQLFDIVYPLIYAGAIAGACIAAAAAWRRAGRPGLATAGVAMAWLAFAAAIFDYVENVGLAVSLWDEPMSPWPQIAFVAAILKFTASNLALLYALSGLIAAVLARRRRTEAPAG